MGDALVCQLPQQSLRPSQRQLEPPSAGAIETSLGPPAGVLISWRGQLPGVKSPAQGHTDAHGKIRLSPAKQQSGPELTGMLLSGASSASADLQQQRRQPRGQAPGRAGTRQARRGSRRTPPAASLQEAPTLPTPAAFSSEDEKCLLVIREFMMTCVALAFTTGALSTLSVADGWVAAGEETLASPSSACSREVRRRLSRAGDSHNQIHSFGEEVTAIPFI